MSSLTAAQYQRYVEVQREKTQRAADHLAWKRVTALTGLLVRTIPERVVGLNCLSIGCRNEFEPAVLRAAGFFVQAIDLHPMFPGIIKMDMHQLDFEPGFFDVMFACHSLEHAYDTDKALSSMVRILKPGGYVAFEVPILYKTTEVDRRDFKSADVLASICEYHGLKARAMETHVLEKPYARYIGQLA